ncbi:MAG: NAD-dependent epimerase/dehydratase family protein [Saprospiraceae bacterium]|nr:NAD-dependent epimerase/dehydratase family protein [Saprospiraceae bacterium]
MNKQFKIIITGGSGFIGSYIVRQLLEAGYKDLHCFKRASSDLRLLGNQVSSVSWHDVDLLDIVSIANHIEDASIIIHAAALVSFAPSDKRELLQFNIEGTSNLVNAALDANIEKFIHISSIATLARNKLGKPINESTDAMGTKVSSPYAISKFRSEMEVWRGGGEGLPISILNPSLVIGSGIWNRGSASMFKQVFQGLSFYPSGTTGFVDVRDVARAVLHLMEKEVYQERFLISGENRSYQEILQLISTELGVRSPSIRLNAILNEVAFLFSKMTSMLTSDAKVITRDSLRNASKTYLFDNSKSKAMLDLNYIPIAQTIRQTCEQLKVAADNGYPPTALPLQ